ncbi:saccharopine dehydrogenase NADP-binding domain-containing protein [Aliiglaciecola litoralis]|uniref:Saccharopine dehydrogenase NADP-binding domain-containing protein n=2 Tax=Aliiglaciecola litoralis TaxID=582857 RepID=A0ABN1LRH7_9ALTE
MFAQFPLAEGSPRWAIAGRSEAKLLELKASLGPDAGALVTLVADAQNEQDLSRLCQQTKVIVSTVGPYALYGEAMLKSCVSSGTDYCDLTGEPQWIIKMLKRYEKIAQATGARIVNCCGFDSIPSDLGVMFTQQQAKLRFEQYCEAIYMRVKAAKGSASGGTIASMMNLVKEATTDKQLRRLLATPYALCPANHGFTQRQENLKSAKFDPPSQTWIAPFVMAAINTRIVHRTNSLLDKTYGKNFIYDEAMMMGKGTKGSVYATGLSVGLGGFMLAAALPPTRWFMEKVILPKPGEGPSLKEQQQGYYDLRFFGETLDGRKIQTKVTGDQDPGYGSTAKMLAQAAACLAQDISKSALAGGFWTPASAMGDKLIDRLQKYAGLSFSVVKE